MKIVFMLCFVVLLAFCAAAPSDDVYSYSGGDDNRDRNHGYKRYGGDRKRDHDDYSHDEDRDRGHEYKRHDKDHGYGEKRKDYRKCGVQKAADPLQLQGQGKGRDKRSVRNSRLAIDKITGGTQVSLISDPTGGQLCWQVVLYNLDNIFCNGVIVGEKTILTTATCLFNSTSSQPYYLSPNKLFVFTGMRRIPTGAPWPDPTDVVDNCGREKYSDWNVAYVTPHPDFDNSTKNNDIAIVTLSESLDFSKDCVCPICLEKKEPPVGQLCAVSGFGDDKNVINANPNFPFYNLNYLDVLVLQNVQSNCFFLSPNTDAELFVCAGGVAGQDACGGDGGDPLACWDEDRQGYYLGGLFSIQAQSNPPNPNVCGAGLGSQYVKVAHYYDWIIKNAYEDLGY